MIDLERQRENFKNHIATFVDYGNIKILDFKAPDTSHYRIRFMFEEDYCRLHISGDLGELIATNYNNMTYDGFKAFVNNTGYFEEKIDCLSRKIYSYDENKAKQDLLELIEECGLKEELGRVYKWKSEEESINDVIDDILLNFNYDTGIGSEGYDSASEHIIDFWENVEYIGREETGILDLYMLAFELATEQLGN